MDISWTTSGDSSNRWGRGSESGSTTNDNYYKAHRGLSQITQEPICNPSPENVEWGKTAESCEEGPFQFTHHYRCTSGLLNWINQNDRACSFSVSGDNTITNSPCTIDSNSCVFQPRVHVLDNWGYCTGVCGTDPSDERCFIEENECNFDFRPTPTNQSINPWVNYNGYITVNPD